MFDRLARRAIGAPIANAVSPRIRTPYDDAGTTVAAPLEVVEKRLAGEPVVAPRRAAPLPRDPLAPRGEVSADHEAPPPARIADELARPPASEHAQPIAERARVPIDRAEAAEPEPPRTTGAPDRDRLVAPAPVRPSAPVAPASAFAPASPRAPRDVAPPASVPQRDAIRVHIGRVDVRAVFPAPAAPAPRAPERAQPAVTLDKFLSRDRGRDR